MHSPGVRAISSAACSLTARVPSVARRSFHSRPARLNSHGNGGKPAEDSAAEQDDDFESQSSVQTSGGRLRSSASASQRTRQAKQRVASALPPVHLPKTFLDQNILLWDRRNHGYLPPALKVDAMVVRTSQLVAPPSKAGKIGKPGSEAETAPSPSTLLVQQFFEECLDYLLMYESENPLDLAELGNESDILNHSYMIENFIRTWDMIIDSAWHLTDALYPARDAHYIYKVRPFWWWHFYKIIDPKTGLPDPRKKWDLGTHDSTEFNKMWSMDMIMDHPVAHAIADLPWPTLYALVNATFQAFNALPPPSLDAKNSKRPINILSISGYGGKSIAQSVAARVAYANGADLIHLDAYDFSELIGDYLGQNCAYARGAVSMMGYRAAELNGKMLMEPETPPRAIEDDDEEIDAGILGRTLSSSMEDEVQKKLKHRGGDVFSKWDSLKVDKVLNHILRAAKSKSSLPTGERSVLVHIHDIVEMGMTLEGSIILNRLRALADEAWHQGTSIVILGTSSTERPSEEYQNALRDLAYEDFVITRHIEPHIADKVTFKQRQVPYKLQNVDYTLENARNINRMIRALNPAYAHITVPITEENVLGWTISKTPNWAIVRDSILPLPEVHSLALAVATDEFTTPGSAATGLLRRVRLGPRRQDAGQESNSDDSVDAKSTSGEGSKAGDESRTEGRAPQKLNEYEKRVSTGQINRDNLKVSFADVHAPPETISALKLLTSLALVRPDAFSYGVLASDKIPGCLLYGPPGTGKTMLAKAVAKESGANMLEISGASINDKWVGESEKLIRAVFTLAKKMSPCVVFIDEADSLLASRSMFSNRASHREHINQFLKEWDGMQETSAFIMVATNRPFDLDEAVLRRLPRKILVDLPMRTDRAAILRLLLRDETLDESVNLEEYAERTAFYSGSDLKNVCVAAAMAAVEEENEASARHTGSEPYQYPERRILTKAHFERAMHQIPASISEDMDSLKQIRKFDEEYGNRRKGRGKKSMGFGILADQIPKDSSEARIRQ